MSCTSFQKRPLTFISNSTLHFKMSKDSVKDKWKMVNTTVYQTDGDSFKLKVYRSEEILDYQWADRYDHYYFSSTYQPYVDLIILDFYKEKISTINIYSRESSSIDSLLMATELFFGKKFSKSLHNSPYDSLKYGSNYSYFKDLYTIETGGFLKNKIYVSYSKDLVYKEICLTLENRKVKLPSFCGTWAPWWWPF